MKHWLDHSLVLAADYRVSRPDRFIPVLRNRRRAFATLGAHHVLVYESTSEPGRFLVLIAIHTRGPVLELLRSRAWLDWFDAVGVGDIPAVFAGELSQRLELDSGRGESRAASIGPVPEVVVSMVTPVADVDRLRAHVLATADELDAAGVRKLFMFSAFDDVFEVMMLVQIDHAAHARTWLQQSDLAHQWLARAGIGAYPPLFVGRLRGTIGISGRDDPGLPDGP